MRTRRSGRSRGGSGDLGEMDEMFRQKGVPAYLVRCASRGERSELAGRTVVVVEGRLRRASAREHRRELAPAVMYFSQRSRGVRYLTSRAARAASGCRNSKTGRRGDGGKQA